MVGAVGGMGRKTGTIIYDDGEFVVVMCLSISKCRRSCRLARSYEKDGYKVVCLNSKFFRPNDVGAVVDEMRKNIKRIA